MVIESFPEGTVRTVAHLAILLTNTPTNEVELDGPGRIRTGDPTISEMHPISRVLQPS